MNAMTEVQAREMQWFAVRMKPNANGAQKTAVINVEKEQYINRAGKLAYRKVKGTGKRVFLPEHLLKRAGFEVFLPVEKVWRIKNRFTKEKHLVAKPKLADWMFVGWPADQSRWLDLMSFNMVAGIMGTGGRPIQMSDAKMLDLMLQFSADPVPKRVERRVAERRVFGVGDVARVLDGPFVGFDLRVIDVDGENVKGLLSLMGGDIKVELAVDILTKDDGSKA